MCGASLAGSHSGSSVHGCTPRSTRKSSSTQVTVVSGPAVMPASMSANVIWSAGPVATNGPVILFRATSTAQAPRSRWSISRIDKSGRPGASTSPPRAIRPTQYGKRPVSSYGPMIMPARSCAARPGKCCSMARSEPTLYGPYSSGSNSPSGEPASGAQSCTGLSSRIGSSPKPGYALIEDTKT
jgi:hypothetical protein